MVTLRGSFRPVNAPASPIDVRSGSLPPSKTHKARGWHFVPAADPSAPELGRLVITQSREATVYLVGLSDAGDELFFAKQDDAADVYAVRLIDGRPAGCTCKGYRFLGKCKHHESSAEVLSLVPATAAA